MRKTIKGFLSRFNLLKEQYYKKGMILTLLSVGVIFGVVNFLKLPANTLEHDKYQQTIKGLNCEYMNTDVEEEGPIIVHTHDAYCIEEWCTLPEREPHEHTTSCYEESLTCELSDAQTLSIHEHDETCYATEKQLTCELEEVASHQHTEACNTTQLQCELVEGEEHTHEEACYVVETCEIEEIEGHSHDDACYQVLDHLICEPIDEEPVHTHTETCYSTTETCSVPDNEIAHQHTEACYIFEEEDQDIQIGNVTIKLLLNTEGAKGNYQFELFVDGEEAVDWSSVEGKELLTVKETLDSKDSSDRETFSIPDGTEDSTKVTMRADLGDSGIEEEYWFENIPQKVRLKNSDEEPLPVKFKITRLDGTPVQYSVNDVPILDGVVDIQDQDVVTVRIDAQQNEEMIFTTDHTLEKYIGEYTIEKILSNYNVFSFTDIESTHIVGPIIAKDKAYRTRNDGPLSTNPDNWDLAASDWSRGKPSYVGRLTSTPRASNDARSFKLNYKFDGEINPVTLYVSNANELLFKEIAVQNDGAYREGTQNEKKRFVFKDGEREILSPNHVGEWPVLMNDNFVDWKLAEDVILDQSQKLMNKETNIEVGTTTASDNSQLEPYTINETTGYLKLDAGKNYTIKDAKGLRLIDIVFPPGYGPVAKGDIKPMEKNTIINLANPVSLEKPIRFSGFQAGEYVGEKTYRSIWDAGVKDVYLFPTIFIDGKPLPQTGMGAGEEFVQEGGRIVLNMPTVDGRLLKHDGYEIMAHIIAPQAEFWSATSDGGGKWEGGNLNGSAIVKSYHGGNIEAHMYPYTGDLEEEEKEEATVDLSLEGKKSFYDNGVLKQPLEEGEFKFILKRADEKDGVLDKNLPQTVSVGADGTIKFLPITFNKPGEYSFIIQEVTEPNIEGMVYDLTTYKVIATVSEVGESLQVTTKIFKVTTETGETIDPPKEAEDGIVFVNTKGINELVEFSFDKVAAGEAGVGLPGAQFTLQEVKSTTDHTVKPDAPIYKATSNEEGKVHFTHIPTNAVYKMLEVVAPDGYEKPAEGHYWIVEITGINETLTITITAIGDEPFKEMTRESQSGSTQIVNQPNGEKGFKIKKVDASNNGLGLEGAIFAIYEAKVGDTGKPVQPLEPRDKDAPLLKDLTTDETGYIQIIHPELEYNKIYLLEETQAPIGYVGKTGYIPFYIKEPNGTEMEGVDDLPNLVIIENMVGEIIIENDQYELPETGGTGTKGYTLIGLCLIAIATGCSIYRKRIMKNY